MNTLSLPFAKDFDRFFVGFDDQWNRLSKLHDDLTKNIPNYPPYNIRKTGENTYTIELAVAGFGQQDIDIEIEGDRLTVRGRVESDAKEAPENFLFKGISNRAFARTFAINDHIEVKNAEMINGMLQIFLERIIPEHKKPRKIDIKTKGEKQLLVE